jgi:hypothetical protein
VAAVAAVAFAIPSVAQATTVHCGETVRKDVILNKDLDCSAGGTGGLVVGADGITIDLNHHKIIGAGGPDGYEGIENDGFNDVTIENGTVARFQDQLLLNDVTHNTVEHMFLKPSSFGYWNGINMNYGTGNQFLDNTINNAYYSIVTQNGSANQFIGNTFNNGTYGLLSTSETTDRVVNNLSNGFSFSTYGFYSLQDVGTVYRGDGANGGYQGFFISGPTNLVLKGVTANHNTTSGIYADSTQPSSGTWELSVFGGTANDNGDYGIYSPYPVKSGDNVALRNALHNCNLVRCNG